MTSILKTAAVLISVAGLSAVLVRSPFRYWVYLLLLCVPFDVGFTTGLIPRLSIVDYFSAAGLMALGIGYKREDWIPKIVGVFGLPLLTAWVLFLMYGSFTTLLLAGSFKGVLRWGEFLFVYVIGMLALQENDSTFASSVAAILSFTGSLMAVWALVQFWQSDKNYEMTYAIFNEHNGLGAFLSLCLPASWAAFADQSSGPFRAVMGLLALLITLAFIASYSRGAWMGLLGAAILVALLRGLMRRKAVYSYAVLGFLLIGAGAALPISWIMHREHTGQSTDVDYLPVANARLDHSRLFMASERTQYWKAAEAIFAAHPWLGLGPKNYDRKIPDYLSPAEHRHWQGEMWSLHQNLFWQHLHNMYLQILAEYGLVGFLLWAGAMALLIVPLLRPSELMRSAYPTAFQISGIAFLIHNNVDILFVNSFDLVFVIFIVLARQNMSAA